MDYGSGTLFLTTENARWLETSGGRELTFHWRSMLMHAVSRDTSSFPHPCIYCQVHTCTHTHKKYSRRDGRLTRLPGQVRKEDVPGAESNGTRGEGAQDEEEDEANGMMPDEEATRDVRYTVEDADMLGVLFQGCLSRPLFSRRQPCVLVSTVCLRACIFRFLVCSRVLDGWMGMTLLELGRHVSKNPKQLGLNGPVPASVVNLRCNRSSRHRKSKRT